jgi:hypothetical protein
MTWDVGYTYVSTPFFVVMLGMSIFAPPLAFVLGWWVSSPRDEYIYDVAGHRTKHRMPK